MFPHAGNNIIHLKLYPMNQKLGIWIDQSRASLISVSEQGTSLRTIQSHIESRERIPGEGKDYGKIGHQYIDYEKKKINRKTLQKNEFLKDILNEIKEVEELVVFGPAEMKTELRKAIEKDRFLSPRLKAVENAGKMTDNQLKAWVKDYFKTVIPQ
jgi:stalled ribosome rescue protein Dom34